MGAFLDKPQTEKQSSSGSGNGLHFAVSTMQGWRVDMEDAHVTLPCLSGIMKTWSFFAVFDGHAGPRASKYCASHLLTQIISVPPFSASRSRQELRSGELSSEAVVRGIQRGFLQVDADLRAALTDGGKSSAWMDHSGTTAVTLLVSPRHLYFVNCGDSRAVLYREGEPYLVTEDHKPSNPQERQRIESAGSSVLIHRVNGALAVSRALGDFDYKNVDGKAPTEQPVSPEPEVYALERGPVDDFAILACDGIWDVMSNEELGAFVHTRLQSQSNLESICEQLLDTCLQKGSRDNMTALLICFSNPELPDVPGCKQDDAGVRSKPGDGET
uniref:protein phosphatase 1B-like n=1 Tax=Myxine glutinosa TaxID=7769 RepID=UPI00358EFBE6